MEHVHAAMQADGGKLPRSIGQIAREVVETHRGDGPGRRELAAQLVEIGVLAADPDRNGNRNGQKARILGAEEGVEEARPGIGRDQDALAACESGTDQLAGDDLRPVADVTPRQGRELLTLGIIKGHARLALRRMVEHRRHGGEAGTMQGEL